MARGTQFGQLVTMLRNDVGRSSDVSVGPSDLPELKQQLNTAYEFLHADYDWPHLRQFFPRITLGTSQRFYDFPATLDYSRIERAVVWYNGRPIEIEREIRHEDYFVFDSEDGETSAPVLKWDVRFTGTKEQCEVWPMPSDNSQKLGFVGIVKFVRLVNDIDTCVIDDNLVVLHASSVILSRMASKDAPLRLSEAQAYYNTLKRRTKGSARIRRVGLGTPGLLPPNMTPRFFVTVR